MNHNPEMPQYTQNRLILENNTSHTEQCRWTQKNHMVSVLNAVSTMTSLQSAHEYWLRDLTNQSADQTAAANQS